MNPIKGGNYVKENLCGLGGYGPYRPCPFRKLLEKGQAVKALGRNAKKLSTLKAKGAEPLSPEFTDAAALAAAFKGAEGVFVMIPPNYAVDDFQATKTRPERSSLRH